MCKQNIACPLNIIVNSKLRYQPLILSTVNSAEKLVITVWEDFRELVGGAGGGIVHVCV